MFDGRSVRAANGYVSGRVFRSGRLDDSRLLEMFYRLSSWSVVSLLQIQYISSRRSAAKPDIGWLWNTLICPTYMQRALVE